MLTNSASEREIENNNESTKKANKKSLLYSPNRSNQLKIEVIQKSSQKKILAKQKLSPMRMFHIDP